MPSDMMSMIAKLPEVFGGSVAQAFLRTTRQGRTGRGLLPGKLSLVGDLAFGALVRWEENEPTYEFTTGTALALADAAIELASTPTFMSDIGASDAAEAHPDSLKPRIRFQDYS